MKENVEFEQGFKPKGKIKVELMDISGEVIHKQETENFIAKPVQKIYDELMRDVFTLNRGAGRYRYADIHFDPFNSLELTDATHPEDTQNEWVRAGNVIGYAYTTNSYSGTDTLRGSYNLIESFTNREQVHIVVDFPTHAGNGTFQSIYFMAGRNNLSTAAYSKFNNNQYYKIVKHNGVVYAFSDQSTNSTLYILNEETYEQIEDIPLGRSYYDFCIVGNKIYFLANRELYSANISNPSEATMVKDDFSYVYGINYNPTTGRWFISNGREIDMYDSGWNLLSTYTGLNYRNTNNNKIIAVTEEGIITSYGDFIHTGGTYDGQLVQIASIPTSTSSDQPRLAGVVEGNLLYSYTGSGSTGGLYKIPLINIGSRALLDEPVTKGNTQTMKITYDFMLPPMN